MSVKIEIDSRDLPKKYQKESLRNTINGASQTVYYLGNWGVLKVFEESYPEQKLRDEINLNRVMLKNFLKVPKLLDRFKIKNFEAIVYEKIKGNSPNPPSINQVESICNFLDEFHKIDFKVDRESFDFIRLEKTIKEIGDREMKEIFKSLNISPNNHTIIHGDLFIDNSKFINNKLMGVFDFSDVSMGDKRFDFGVVALSWCSAMRTENLIKKCILTIFKWVESDFVEFLDFIGYPTLFYATKRKIDGRNHQNLIKFYRELKEIKW